MAISISTPNAPQAIGPYSQAVESGNFIFVSGQLGINIQTGKIEPDNFSEQCVNCLENIKSILEAAGTSMERVVRTTIYIIDMNEFTQFNEIYSHYFNGRVLPARVCFEVSALPKNGLIEIDAIAEKD